MRYLSVAEVVALHDAILAATGGATGLRDLNGLDSAVAQPHAGFGGEQLYPSLSEKAAALCFSLVMNHAFVDGNKRVGHAAMEVYLRLNGHELMAPINESEATMLALAAGQLSRPQLVDWIRTHLHPLEEDAV